MRHLQPQDSRFYPILYAVVSLAVLGFIMAAYSQQRIEEFRADRADMAQRAAAGTAREIHTYTTELRNAIQVFADENQALIGALARDTGEHPGYASMAQKIQRYFPEHVAFAVIDQNGQVRSHTLERPLGAACMAAVRRYAQSAIAPQTTIHANPGYTHFDVMVPWRDPGSAQSGLLFVSIRPGVLHEILQRASMSEYDLYLVDAGPSGLIQADVDAARRAETPLREFQTEGGGGASIRVSPDIPGTAWRVLAELNAQSLLAHERGIWRFTLVTYALFMLLTAFLTWILIRQLGLRRRTENSLRTIATGVSGATGDDFFASVAENLAIALSMRYALVAQIEEGRVKYLTIWDGEGEVSEREGTLEGSALERVIRDAGLEIERGAAGLFPEDTLCRKLGVEGYIGVPLLGSDENTLGVLSVMHDGPIREVARSRAIVEILAARTATEIERLQVQQALMHSEAQYRYLVETSRDILWELDGNGRWVYVNEAAQSVYGYRPEEMIGSRFRDRVAPEYAEQCSQAFERVLRNGELRDYEVTHRHKSGRTVHLIYNGKVKHSEEGEVIGMTGTATDITELMKAQAEAKKNSGLFSAVLTNLPVFFFRVDEQGSLSDIRGNGLRRLGVGDYGLVGESVYDLFSGTREEIEQALAGKMVQFEVQGIAKDKLWWFSVSMFFDAWRGKGAVGFAVDVTGRKTAEVKMIGLVRENRALARRLLEVQEDERTKLSRELHDELGQSITAVKSLATAITHLDGERIAEIHSLGHSVIDLSARLYDFAKHLMHRLRPDVVDTLGFREAIDTCLKRSQLEASGVTCGLHAVGDLNSLSEILKITTYRIVQECLTNISKYAMASNVQIMIKRCVMPMDARQSVTRILAEKEVDPEHVQGNSLYRDTLIIHIADDGVGMSLRERANDDGTQPRGVGLQGIRERVTALGGELDIKSAAGKGVQLTVSIDIGEADHCDIAQKESYNEASDEEERRHEANENIVG